MSDTLNTRGTPDILETLHPLGTLDTLDILDAPYTLKTRDMSDMFDSLDTLDTLVYTTYTGTRLTSSVFDQRAGVQWRMIQVDRLVNAGIYSSLNALAS